MTGRIDPEPSVRMSRPRLSTLGWPIPTAGEYLSALHQMRIGPFASKMLRIHLGAADRTVSMREMARAVGPASAGAVQLHYGYFAHEVFRNLSVPGPKRGDGRVVWTDVVAEAPLSAECGPERPWRMFDELAEALILKGV